MEVIFRSTWDKLFPDSMIHYCKTLINVSYFLENKMNHWLSMIAAAGLEGLCEVSSSIVFLTESLIYSDNNIGFTLLCKNTFSAR